MIALILGNLWVLIKGGAIGFAVAAPVGPIGMLCIRTTLERGRVAGLRLADHVGQRGGGVHARAMIAGTSSSGKRFASARKRLKRTAKRRARCKPVRRAMAGKCPDSSPHSVSPGGRQKI